MTKSEKKEEMDRLRRQLRPENRGRLSEYIDAEIRSLEQLIPTLSTSIRAPFRADLRYWRRVRPFA